MSPRIVLPCGVLVLEVLDANQVRFQGRVTLHRVEYGVEGRYEFDGQWRLVELRGHRPQEYSWTDSLTQAARTTLTQEMGPAFESWVLSAPPEPFEQAEIERAEREILYLDRRIAEAHKTILQARAEIEELEARKADLPQPGWKLHREYRAAH